MYTIKRAAELTGVPAASLRAWERRYGLVEPERTESGYRLYDEAALERIRAMAALLDQGWSAATAAQEVRQRAEAQAAARAPEPPATQSPGTPTPAPLSPTGERATEQLITAAAALDPAGVAAVLDERFALASFEQVVDDWLMPALDEVGLAWADGRITVAGEHLVAQAVLRRLAATYDAAARPPSGPAVVVGLPAGVHHELGLFAFAVALRRAGVDVVYLGRDLPVDAWRATIATHRPRCVVTSAPNDEDLPAARELVTALHASHPDVPVHVGGGRQDDVESPGATRLGHAIGPAAALLAASLS